MIIGIDGNLLCGNKTGMGTVVYNILKYWTSTDECKIKVFVSEQLQEEYCNLLKENGIDILYLESSNYFKWEQIDIPKAVKKEKIDVLWCPYNTAPVFNYCKIAVTIHDMIYMSLPIKEVPSLYKKMGVIYRRKIVPIAARKANAIFTISEFAKQEICKYLPRQKEKVNVLYNGIDYICDTLDKNCTQKFFASNKINKPFILGFGSLESRKNTLGLIKAYESLRQDIKDEYQLVLFGFRGYESSKEYKYIRKKKISGIRILGYVSEEEKNTLYKASNMFVFPTFSEGFGIPVLEAFANKTPVITSNVTSLPEIVEDAAILIEPTNYKAIGIAMESLINDIDLRNNLIKKGLVQVNKFNWKDTSEKVFSILKSIY